MGMLLFAGILTPKPGFSLSPGENRLNLSQKRLLWAIQRQPDAPGGVILGASASQAMIFQYVA
jgi:hypothetical protein